MSAQSESRWRTLLTVRVLNVFFVFSLVFGSNTFHECECECEYCGHCTIVRLWLFSLSICNYVNEEIFSRVFCLVGCIIWLFCPMVHSYIRKMIVVPRVFTDRLESWLLYAQFADCVGVVFVVDVVPVLTCLIDIPHDNFHSQFGQAEWQ